MDSRKQTHVAKVSSLQSAEKGAGARETRGSCDWADLPMV